MEALGGEVQLPDFGEWGYHTSATGKLDNSIKQKDLYYRMVQGTKNLSFSEVMKKFPNYLKGIRYYASNRILNRVLHRYHKLLERPIMNGKTIKIEEADIYEVWDNAEPYIIKWFGEGALSIGKSIQWIKKGVTVSLMSCHSPVCPEQW